MTGKLRLLSTGAAFCLAAALAAQPASAQKSVEDFYKGKNIDMVIGYAPGGGYDLYARMVAQHIGNHIPG